MSSFKIPKGKTYVFTITVLEKNSYLPRDLSAMNELTSSFGLVKLDTLVAVVGTITIDRIPDAKTLPTDPDTFVGGQISVTIPNTITGTLAYERGDKVDGYYLKPTYQGLLNIKFTDGSPDVDAMIPDIYVIPTGL